MTERKPPGTSWESWVDRQIREATERGVFDDLPGAGKPLPDVDEPHDENWWVRRKLREEGLSGEALLPPALALRKEVERLPATVRDLSSEQSVRSTVRELNLRIADYLRAPTPPWVPVRPVDADAVVARWREERTRAGGQATGATRSGHTRTGATRTGETRTGQARTGRPPGPGAAERRRWRWRRR